MNHSSGHFLKSLFCLAFIWLSLQTPIFAQDAADLLKIADEYYENEQFHSAAQYYQVAAGLQPENAEINYRLAQCYQSIFDYAMAANYFQRSMEQDEVSFPLAPFYLAQMEKSMGNFKQAKDGFERFIKTNKKSSLIPSEQKSAYIKQAEIEMQGSIWAIEQLGKSWRDMGFRLLPEPVNSVNNDYAAVPASLPGMITLTSGRKGVKGSLVDNRFGDYFTDNLRFKNQGNDAWVPDQSSDHFDRTNTKFSDGVGTYNATGDKYYFTSCYEGNAFCKLYVIYRENGSWRSPTLLNENVNAPGYDNKHPALSTGGDTLIFISNRPGGPGGNDLWYSVLEGEENWQSPSPLPGAVNTPFNEASPYCYGNNLLFFSSDGHAGIGSVDIFMAENYASTNSTIQNLGTPFNSGYDDSFFSLGQGLGYLSSNRPGGKGKFDIYAFNFPVENQDLAQFLEETAEGSHLRSRIRDRDASNLFASRDEDQFYYDNLSGDERARLDRILLAKQASEGIPDLSSLSKDDVKYYHKLDIGTKAIIERLALKKAMELEGLAATSQMSPQQKLDWEYYQNIDEVEKAIIDRILNVRVEGRRMALSKLSRQERVYTSDPRNKDRIESKVQLRSLMSLANTLNYRTQLGQQKYQQNQSGVSSAVLEDKPNLESRASAYTTTIEALGASHKLFYHSLDPERRDDIHQSALRQAVKQANVNQSQYTVVLSDVGLLEDPFNPSAYQETGDRQKAMEVKTAIEYQLKTQIAESNLSALAFTKQELAVQQGMLERHLGVLSQRELETQVLQQQLQQYLEEQENAPDPAMEAKIVEEYYTQLQDLPFLTPKESYYFNSLSPGQLLRLERLTTMVDDQTNNRQQDLSEKEFLAYQQATDQWYYLELPQKEQQMVDQLIAHGWNLDSPEISEFVMGLDHLERDRIDRMMGNKNLNLELQSSQRIAINQELEQQSPSKQIVDTSGESEQELLPISGSTEIYFDFDQHTLRAEARKTLTELQEYLKQAGKPVTVVIEGHTDNTGSKSYNQKLAERRSQSAAQIFRAETDLIQITTKSLGEERPAFDNQTASGRQMNRRVELKISGLPYQSGFRTYLVKPNVTLSMIAMATGLQESDIIRWNGQIGKKPRAYQPIRLPADLEADQLRSVLYFPGQSKPDNDKDQIHTVAKGENLFRLAQMYHTTVQTLEELNQTSSNDLMLGQQIRVR